MVGVRHIKSQSLTVLTLTDVIGETRAVFILTTLRIFPVNQKDCNKTNEKYLYIV